MSLHPEEPAVAEWLAVPLRDIAKALLDEAPVSRPRIVAVDGRSGAGKSTVAARLCGALPAASVVHLDDVAWGHSFFGWVDLLTVGILERARCGEPVRFRPPGWDRVGRAGALEVPAKRQVVIVEGVGAGRHELAPAVDVTIWVQSDAGEARQRGIARDGGNRAAEEFWDEYAAAERPFLAHHRPWDRANLMIAGTPRVPHDPHAEVVVAPGPIQPPTWTVPNL